jgi:hypothetical protein
VGWWSSILLAVIDVNVIEELACRNSLSTGLMGDLLEE